MRFFNRNNSKPLASQTQDDDDVTAKVEKVGSDVTTEEEEDERSGMEVDIDQHESYASQFVVSNTKEPDTANYDNPRRKKMCLIGLAIFLLLAIIGTSVGVGVTKRRNNTPTRDFGGADSVPDAPPLSEDGEYVLEELKQYTPEILLRNNVLSQGQAFSSLVTYEEASNGRTPSPRLVQRYALMTLYYSTSPDLWVDSSGWNAAFDDHCLWSGVDSCQVEDDYLMIKSLTINSNNLDGTIPTEICLLGSSLYNLDLGDNKIGGTIPECIQDMVNLEDLILRENELTGQIPNGIMNLRQLTAVDFGVNQLTGTLDVLINGSSPPGLRVLLLDSNDFTGAIPQAFSDFSLLSLTLSNNDLSGSVNHLCDTQTNAILVDCDLDCECCETIFESENERYDMEYCQIL